MSTIDEEKEEDCTVVMYINFETLEKFKSLLGAVKLELENNKFYDENEIKELNRWLDDCVQNYDGVPVEFYSNRKAVVNNKTGGTTYLT